MRARLSTPDQNELRRLRQKVKAGRSLLAAEEKSLARLESIQDRIDQRHDLIEHRKLKERSRLQDAPILPDTEEPCQTTILSEDQD